jgi:hypothetical protein
LLSCKIALAALELSKLELATCTLQSARAQIKVVEVWEPRANFAGHGPRLVKFIVSLLV